MNGQRLNFSARDMYAVRLAYNKRGGGINGMTDAADLNAYDAF